MEKNDSLLAKRRRHGILNFIAGFCQQLGLGSLQVISEMYPYFISSLNKDKMQYSIKSGFLLYPTYFTALFGSVFAGGILEITIGGIKCIAVTLLIYSICGILFNIKHLAVFYVLFFVLGFGVGMAEQVNIRNVCFFFPNNKGLIATILPTVGTLITAFFSYVAEKVVINPKGIKADKSGIYPYEVAERVIEYVETAVLITTIGIVLTIVFFTPFDESNYTNEEEVVETTETKPIESIEGNKDNQLPEIKPSIIFKNEFEGERLSRTYWTNKNYKYEITFRPSTPVNIPEENKEFLDNRQSTALPSMERISLLIKRGKKVETSEEKKQKLNKAVYDTMTRMSIAGQNKEKQRNTTRETENTIYNNQPLLEGNIGDVNPEDYEGYVKAVLKSWRFWKIFVISVCSSFVLTLGTVIFKPLGTQYGFDEADLQSMVVGKLVICAIFTPIAGILADKIKFKYIMIGICVGATLFGVAIIFSKGIFTLYIIAIYFDYFLAALNEAYPQHIMSVFGMKHFIEIIGVFSFSGVISFITGSLLTFVLTEVIGGDMVGPMQLVFVIGCILSIIATFFAFSETDERFMPSNLSELVLAKNKDQENKKDRTSNDQIKEEEVEDQPDV